MPSFRRLAAVLAADIAGYSRLVGIGRNAVDLARRALRVAEDDPGILVNAASYWPISGRTSAR
jgi:hypothetical protein